MSLYIGLMSGTSMDGIDAAVVDVRLHKLIYGITKKYTPETKALLEELLSGSNLSMASICQLNTLIGREFAQAANSVLQEAKLSAHDVKAIGSHGQTVCHNISSAVPYTLQLGCAHTIAEHTGITVIADFRTRDVVNGGQGAPFAPLYHQELLRQRTINTAVVNIGGIANITFLKSDEVTTGWDVGPGNCLMDAWIAHHQGKSFDENGAWAKQGEVIDPLLMRLLADDFIRAAVPKSIGKEYFSLSWLEKHLKQEYKPEDVQKTLATLTAQTIADAIMQEQYPVYELYLCGGGTYNEEVQQTIAALLPETAVKSIAEIGIDPDYLEAMIFAWLASKTLNHQSVDLRAITGSGKPAILGAIYPFNHK